MVANILPAAPLPPDPRVKMSNLTFAQHDHVAYQIKGNCECSNMVANILPAAPLSPQKVKIQLFQNMVMLHIKETRRNCMPTSKAQTSLHIRAVWSAPLLFAPRKV